MSRQSPNLNSALLLIMFLVVCMVTNITHGSTNQALPTQAYRSMTDYTISTLNVVQNNFDAYIDMQRNLGQLILQASKSQNNEEEQTQPNDNSFSILSLRVPSKFDVM